MFNRRSSLGLAAIALAFCANARAAQAPLDANDAVAVKALISDLGNPEYAAREKAQAALETVPYGQIETLRKYAAAVADPEAKARLAEAIDRVEEIGITTEPPITVDLKNATRQEVAEALSKAMQTSLTTLSTDDERFTLKAENQSPWEILHRLDEQHPLWLSAPGTLARMSVEPQTTRGIAVYALLFSVDPDSSMVRVKAVADPRLKLLAMQPPQVDSARDQAGRNFVLLPNAPEPLPGRFRSDDSAISQSASFRYQVPALAASAGTFKGSVTCLIEVSETKTEIADAGKHLGEAISLGDAKVTLRDISPAKAAGARAGLQLEIVPDDSKVAAPAAPIVKFTASGMSINGGLITTAGTRLIIDNEGSTGGMLISSGGPSPGATHVTVTDAIGKTIANYSIPRGLPVTSIHAVPGDFKEPLKFTFTTPTKTREVVIPFEFKSLPVK